VVGGTASGGGSLTIEVRPAVRTGYTIGTNVFVYQPSARMIIIPDSYSELITPPAFGQISFKAIQTL
jgi:hypothetical protein